jgi:hypothetical protein
MRALSIVLDGDRDWWLWQHPCCLRGHLRQLRFLLGVEYRLNNLASKDRE